jgi:hypothetical protein
MSILHYLVALCRSVFRYHFTACLQLLNLFPLLLFSVIIYIHYAFRPNWPLSEEQIAN